MTPAYMPFTYIPESTARQLFALVGPVVIYQPLKKNIPNSLSVWSSQGLVEIRTPITRNDDRLGAALVEFMEWARMNPGKSTAGAGFLGARQGETPFFDETTVNRIRSDIKRYHQADHLADSQTDETEFSARLFLALAQENDRATDRLDHDLKRFKMLEKNFLEALKDTDEAGFNRQPVGGEIWRDDPGAKLTDQRIRAWATLATADAQLPQLLITTSRAVIDTLLESYDPRLPFEKLTEIRLSMPADGTAPVLGRVLADLAVQENLPSTDFSALASLAADATAEQTVTATLFVALNRTPATVIRRMAPATAVPPDENGKPESGGHTLIVLVES